MQYLVASQEFSVLSVTDRGWVNLFINKLATTVVRRYPIPTVFVQF